MFLDGRELANNTIIDADICIVGSGIAGITLAHELNGGPFPRDLGLVERLLQHPEDIVGRQLRIAILEGGGLEPEEEPDFYSGENVGHPYLNLEASRTRGLGGSGNSWGGYCMPFDEFDLEIRKRIPASGWPFRLDEITEYIERAQDICNLGPSNYEFDFWAARSPSLKINPFRSDVLEMRVLQQANFDGNTYREMLRASENITVYYNTNVTELVFSGDGEQRVEFVRTQCVDGPEIRFSARQIVLAAGGIENARLMLLSISGRPEGLGNQHDLVGRYFMDHLNVRVGRFHPKVENMRKRFFPGWHDGGEVIIKSSVAVSRKIRQQEELLRCFFELSPKLPWGVGMNSYGYIKRSLRRRRFPKNLKYHLGTLWAERVPLLRRALGQRKFEPNGPFPLHVSAEPSPNRDSRITLSERLDELGRPQARLDWRIADLDRDHIQRSLELFKQEARAAGLGRLELYPRNSWRIYGHHHHMGTTRMHIDPRHGVVDEDCRVHGTSNLYVAGSSVFPTAGGGTATFMISVLSIRLADHLKSVRE